MPVDRIELSIDQLELDPQNPRLPSGSISPSQDELIAVLAKDYSLGELARSFLDNGYFQEEPLVVVPHGSLFRVVEGNRRLATLKILSDPRLVDLLRLGPEWRGLAGEWAGRAIAIPVLVYSDREDIIPFLGFRHISGVKQWRPREKAKF